MAGGAARPGSGPFWAEPSRQRNEDFSEGRQGPLLKAGIGLSISSRPVPAPRRNGSREALQREDLSPRAMIERLRCASRTAGAMRSLWVQPLWARMGERSSRRVTPNLSNRATARDPRPHRSCTCFRHPPKPGRSNGPRPEPESGRSGRYPRARPRRRTGWPPQGLPCW